MSDLATPGSRIMDGGHRWMVMERGSQENLCSPRRGAGSNVSLHRPRVCEHKQGQERQREQSRASDAKGAGELADW